MSSAFKAGLEFQGHFHFAKGLSSDLENLWETFNWAPMQRHGATESSHTLNACTWSENLTPYLMHCILVVVPLHKCIICTYATPATRFSFLIITIEWSIKLRPIAYWPITTHLRPKVQHYKVWHACAYAWRARQSCAEWHWSGSCVLAHTCAVGGGA